MPSLQKPCVISMLQIWIDAAEKALTTPLISEIHETVRQLMLASQAQQDQKDLLGMVIAFRALLHCYQDYQL